MTTDKNGKELKIGDWVIFHPEPGRITWLFADGDIELDDDDSQYHNSKYCTYISPENLEKVLVNEPVEPVYSVSEIKESFQMINNAKYHKPDPIAAQSELLFYLANLRRLNTEV